MNIIVPTDFSALSLNAVRFAAKMLTGHDQATLVLYNAYDSEKKAADAEAQLKALKNQILAESSVKIEAIAEKSDDFVESLDKKAHALNAVLVVMAITEKSRLEQVVSGSNSLKLIEKSLCPVLVVPQDAVCNGIKNVVLTSDFKDVENSIPLEAVKKVLSIFTPNLHIVNINSEIYVSLTEEHLAQRTALLNMFKEFKPEFYFLTTYDFHETLNRFANDKNIDMVLIFPKKHSFVNNLLKVSNTKKLVSESSIPVLAAHN